jgi:hypothetical protein
MNCHFSPFLHYRMPLEWDWFATTAARVQPVTETQM